MKSSVLDRPLDLTISPVRRRLSADTFFLATILGSIALHALVLTFGAVDGHDADVHLRWLSSFASQCGPGDWYPRWMDASFGGYGAPIFYLYPPGAAYIGAALSHVLGSTDGVLLYKCVALIGYVGSFFSMRLFLTSFDMDKRAIVYGALLYAVNPYRYYTLFTRSALPEHVAMAIVPLVLWSAYRLYRIGPTRRTIAVLALSLACLIFTNIPSAIATLLAVGCLCLYTLKTAPRLSIALIFAMILGTLAASALLLPVLEVQPRLNIDKLWHPFDHSPLMEIFHSGYYLNQILLPLMFALVALMWWSLRDSYRQATRAWRLALLVCVVIQLPAVAYYLSPYLLPIRLLQFPWRVNVVAVALGFPALFLTTGLTKKALSALLGMATVCTIVAGLATLTDARIGDHTVARTDARPEYLSRFMTAPDALLVYREGALPAATSQGVREVAHSGQSRRYEANLPQPGPVTLRMYYWPYWKAEINGHPAQTRPDTYGRTVLDLPAGHSDVKLTLQRTAAEQAGEPVSAILLLVLIAGIALPEKHGELSRLLSN